LRPFSEAVKKVQGGGELHDGGRLLARRREGPVWVANDVPEQA
jgi:hypothetical protein